MKEILTGIIFVVVAAEVITLLVVAIGMAKDQSE